MDWNAVNEKWNNRITLKEDERRTHENPLISFLMPSRRKLIIFLVLFLVNIVDVLHFLGFYLNISNEGVYGPAYRMFGWFLNLGVIIGGFAGFLGIFVGLNPNVYMPILLPISDFAYLYVLSCFIAWLFARKEPV